MARRAAQKRTCAQAHVILKLNVLLICLSDENSAFFKSKSAARRLKSLKKIGLKFNRIELDYLI
jgi:hypothetical protein